MAGQTITQRVALEGGQAIKQQLIDIGKAGKEAFQNFTDAVKAAPAFANFTADLEAIKAKAAEVGAAFSELGNGFRELGSKIGESVKRIGEIGLAIVGAATAFALLVKSGADAAEQTKNTAAALGLTTKAYQELQFAFSQVGVEQDKFASGEAKLARAFDAATQQVESTQRAHNDLNKEFASGAINSTQYAAKLLELNQKASEVVNPFTRLGLSIADVTDKSTSFEEKQNLVANAFKGLEDGTQKTATALQLFGRGNVEFVNAMNLGADGLANLRKEAQRLQIPFDDLALKSGAALSNAFRSLVQTSTAAKDSILSVFNPLLTRVVEAFTESIVTNRATLVLLASDIATKITPIVDDLIALLQGRDADVKNDFLLKARDNMVAFGIAAQHAVVDIILPALTALLAILDQVANAVNFVFGSNVTGGEIGIALVITKVIGLFGVLQSAVGVVVDTVRALVVVFGLPEVALAALAFAVGFVFVKAVEAAVAKVAEIWAGLKDIFADPAITDAMKSSFDSFATWFQSTWLGQIIATIGAVISKVKELIGLTSSAGSGSDVQGPAQADGTAPHLASGGAVRGPGSGTSDSIWARVSNGEFVQRQRAVNHYGLSFMEAINQLRIPIAQVRALMGSGVNLQGLMSNMMPRTNFATGGPVLAGAAVSSIGGAGLVAAHIHFGGETFPVMTDKSVLHSLQRSALKAARLRAGKAPGYVGG